MRNLGLKAFGCLIVAAALSLPTWAANSSTPTTAYPGTLNYVEGQASIGSEGLSSKSIGVAQLQPGQSITTENGRAELLLIPGAFLRVGNDSAVKMVSPDLTNTEVAVEKGQATIEVTDLHSQNDLQVQENGATAQIEKNGFYDFDAAQNLVRVLDGQATVQVNDRNVKVKGGHELNLAAPKLKTEKFDKSAYEESSLYKWSSLRSAYVAEANADLAPTYIVNGGYGPGWIGAGWYWSPWFNCYTFVPVGGVFYSPFGWGFYSPFWGYNLGFYAGHPIYRHLPHHFSPDPHAWGPIVRTPPLAHGHMSGLAPSSPLKANPRAFGLQGMHSGIGHSMGPRGFEGGGFRGGMPLGGFRGGFAGRGPGR
ncbi:MAG TPA: FecR domain-containing protein [Candidatus Acidoferrum sp.]|nr:FecR domain-containing protein [Candidatus Acidoferrum sp.]